MWGLVLCLVLAVEEEPGDADQSHNPGPSHYSRAAHLRMLGGSCGASYVSNCSNYRSVGEGRPRPAHAAARYNLIPAPILPGPAYSPVALFNKHEPVDAGRDETASPCSRRHSFPRLAPGMGGGASTA